MALFVGFILVRTHTLRVIATLPAILERKKTSVFMVTKTGEERRSCMYRDAQVGTFILISVISRQDEQNCPTLK